MKSENHDENVKNAVGMLQTSQQNLVKAFQNLLGLFRYSNFSCCGSVYIWPVVQIYLLLRRFSSVSAYPVVLEQPNDENDDICIRFVLLLGLLCHFQACWQAPALSLCQPRLYSCIGV